ncbi:MAG TPA: VOC family protein [Proteiniclasticum sp.]|nr:VOC family protein [Proteiniclasticum sp.]
MGVQILINYNGNCRKAAEYYSEVFDTKPPVFMTFGEGVRSEEHSIPLEAMHLIMYTELEIEGDRIMLSDIFPGMEFTVGNNMNLSVICKDAETATKYFYRMKEKGTVEMELQETEWSPCYGSIIDPYGIHWQFNTTPEVGEFSIES